MCNNYLTYQQNRVESGEINPQWFDDCRRTVEHFAKSISSNRIVLDLGPSDFERYRQKLLRTGLSGKGLGVHAMGRSVTIVKAIFAYAYDTDMIDRPVKFGKSFKRSSASSKRKSRSESQIQNGKNFLNPSDIRKEILSKVVDDGGSLLRGDGLDAVHKSYSSNHFRQQHTAV